MLKFKRVSAPDCLVENGKNWTEDFLAKRESSSGHKFSWRSKSCYQAIRETLSRLTQRHCAFCDGPIGVESRETVEHFRPKSRFPELAFEWTNLFPCCDFCQSCKGEKFEEGLLKPDEPGFAFENHFISNYKTGDLEPSPAVDEIGRKYAELTICLFGLNLPQRSLARKREWERYYREKELNSEVCIDDYNYRFFLSDLFS